MPGEGETGYNPDEEQANQPKVEEQPEINDTKELIADEPKNPFEQRLIEQGIKLEIPPRFTTTDKLPVGTHIDPLTGLPIEEDAMRSLIAQTFTDCVRTGRKWLMVYADVDNLKLANTRHGREFGDMVIKQGAATILQALESTQLSDNVTSYAVRQTGAADETILWVFDPSEEDIQKIKDSMDNASKKVVSSDPKFSFSTTCTVIASNDETSQTFINSAREFSENNPEKIAYEDYQALKERADVEVKIQKVAKDIERLTADTLIKANNFEAIREIILEELGDSRISKVLLDRIIDLSQFEQALKFRRAIPNTEIFRSIAINSIPENWINHLLSENPREGFYKELLSTV